MNTLRVMTVVFNISLKQSELRKFRGAIIKAAGAENTLFHNHVGVGYNYKYPLIQYRIIGGKAAIVCLNEGIEQAHSLFASGFIGSELLIGDENKGVLMIESIRQNEFSLCVLDTPVKYHISRWLPLNQKNYLSWKQISDNTDKMAVLNSILVGNIISFAKGIGWQIDPRIECTIDIDSIITRQTTYKGQPLISFSLDFTANIFFPNGLCLGKGVSSNHGVVLHSR
ncbi:MAG: hypothetical protein II260_07670 [Muribaculaceae bacterium]|nr:hypothetical protein [Muribaculaceae bacterium]